MCLHDEGVLPGRHPVFVWCVCGEGMGGWAWVGGCGMCIIHVLCVSVVLMMYCVFMQMY